MNANKINVKELFGKYHNKLIAEAIIKTLIYGLIAGFAASLLSACVFRLAKFDGTLPALIIGIAAFVFPAVFMYLKKLRPSVKHAAARIDRLGLEERVVTMLELDGESAFIAVKQREDAKKMLKKTNPGQLKIKIPVKYAALLFIVAAVSIYTLSLPPVKPAAAEESAEDPDEALTIVDQMLRELRETINEAEVNDELKKELNELVDKLERSFTENDTAFDKIMKIIEASKEIKKRLEEALNQKKIGEALQQYDSTRELGAAIENSDVGQVDEALENMRENVQRLAGQEKTDELNQMADDIESALSDAGNPEGALPDALQQLAYDIRAAAKLSEKGDNTGADETLSEALEAAAESISEALAEQASISEMMEQIEGIMDASIEMIADEEIPGMMIPGKGKGQGEGEGSGQGTRGKPTGENGEGENGENGEGENGESGEGENDESGEGDANDGGEAGDNRRAVRSGSGTGGEADEGVEASETGTSSTSAVDSARRDAEPVIDGKTPYLDVFDDFFKDAKRQMIDGALSDELRSKAQKYFEIIQ